MDDLLQAHILEQSRSPQKFGALPTPTVSATQNNVSCGDVLTADLMISEDGVLTDLGWSGDGCTITRAAMSVLSGSVCGMKIEDILSLGQKDVEQWLGLTEISPGRRRCLLLGLMVVQAGIRQHLAKK